MRCPVRNLGPASPPLGSPFPAHSPQSSFRKTKEGWLDIETSNYFLEKVIAEQLPLNSAQPNTLTPEDVIRKGASAAGATAEYTTLSFFCPPNNSPLATCSTVTPLCRR